MKLIAITPCLDEERYITTLLADLAKQTREPDLVLIADAGSTDNSLQIIKNFRLSLNIKVIKGGIPAFGRNQGGRLAPKGSLLFFLDSDVSLEPDFFEKVVAEMKARGLESGTCANIPFYRSWEKGANSWWIRVFDLWFYWWHNSFLHITTWFHYPVATGTFIASTKSGFDKINGYNEEIGFAEDSDFSNRVSKVCKWGVLKSVRVLVSTRRFDSKGRLWFPIKVGVYALLFRVFNLGKNWKYFD